MAVECIFVCLSSCALESHGESVGGKSDVGAGLSLWCQCCDFVSVRGGFLHLTEALSFRRDPDLISSTVCAIIATLKSGEKCNVEPELISKGMDVLLLSFAAAAWTSSPAKAVPTVQAVGFCLLPGSENVNWSKLGPILYHLLSPTACGFINCVWGLWANC